MYHAACKVEFQPFNRSYSQLTFSSFLWNRYWESGECWLATKVGAAHLIAVLGKGRQTCGLLETDPPGWTQGNVLSVLIMLQALRRSVESELLQYSEKWKALLKTNTSYIFCIREGRRCVVAKIMVSSSSKKCPTSFKKRTQGNSTSMPLTGAALQLAFYLNYIDVCIL